MGNDTKRYYWLKFPEDFFSSKRIKKLRRLAGGDTFTIIYLKMQLKALKTEGVLEYTGLENSFAEEIALDTEEDPENVAVTLNYCMTCGLIEMVDDNHILLPYAKVSTGVETAAAQRGRRYRESLADEQKEAERERAKEGMRRTRQERKNGAENDSDVRNSESYERVTNVEIEIEKEKDNIVIINDYSSDRKNLSDVQTLWNSLSDVGIKPITKLTDGTKRCTSLRARIKQYGFDEIEKAIRNIRKSDFLQGKNQKGWVITFDWFVLPNNFPKVLEGNYSNEIRAGTKDYNAMVAEEFLRGTEA